jgi:hypothetical protein
MAVVIGYFNLWVVECKPILISEPDVDRYLEAPSVCRQSGKYSK